MNDAGLMILIILIIIIIVLIHEALIANQKGMLKVRTIRNTPKCFLFEVSSF
jgi:hypothetical protein